MEAYLRFRGDKGHGDMGMLLGGQAVRSSCPGHGRRQDCSDLLDGRFRPLGSRHIHLRFGKHLSKAFEVRLRSMISLTCKLSLQFRYTHSK